MPAVRGARKPRSEFWLAVVEIGLWVVIASLVVAIAESFAPVTSLGVVYLLAVLLVAARRGWGAALVAALASVVVFNFWFVDPRFQFGISSSRDLIALAAYLVVAIVVGRLASEAREQARRAEATAQAAVAREREAQILARTATCVLAAPNPQREPDNQVDRVAACLPSPRESGISISTDGTPSNDADLVEVRMRGTAWLRGSRSQGWDHDALNRLAGPLAQLCTVSEERARVAQFVSEAESAQRAQAAKTALLHSVSHDLRSPLTAISTAASAMDPAALPDQDHQALLEVIRGESKRLAGLVEDLLDVSRIESGAVDPRLDWCHLNEVAARAAVLVRDRTGHAIDVDLPSDVLLVRADSVQLERVFCNLLDNAVKFSTDSPVKVSGGVGGGRVHVRVTDDGRGIPLSRRSRVFEPFFRGRGGEGSGLGLAICRGFVEANGGEIKIQDAAPGTSFSVSFPVAQQPAAR